MSLMDRFGYAKTIDQAAYERNKEAADTENKYAFSCKNTGRVCIFTNTGQLHTDETIRLARKYDLTLICQARPDSATVYNDPFGSACAGVPKKEGSSHDE